MLQQPPNTNTTWNAYVCTHAATLCLAHTCVCVCLYVCGVTTDAHLPICFCPSLSFQKHQWEDLVHVKRRRVRIIQRIALLFSRRGARNTFLWMRRKSAMEPLQHVLESPSYSGPDVCVFAHEGSFTDTNEPFIVLQSRAPPTQGCFHMFYINWKAAPSFHLNWR